MNITINRELRKYTEGFKRLDSDVNTMVVHGAGIVGSAYGMIKWMANGGIMPDGTKREDDYTHGIALTQYVIDRDGETTELFNPHNWLYHSRTGKFDKHTVGVELINGHIDNSKQYTPEQYRSLTELYKFLNERINFMPTIVGHGRLMELKTGKTTLCPGTGFDWIFFSFCLRDLGFEITEVDNTGKIEVVR
jgi:hypothetical protein